MALVPVIDELSCAAHGDCEQLAPDVFRVDEVATVVGSGAPELLVEVAAACPATAISLIDAETGQQVYP